MSLNKCPGSDGLSVELYRKFWGELSRPLFECLQAVFNRGFLSNEQKRGIITLLPKKKKDPRYMSSWRPITLLNVDYKILTKTLAKRLTGVLPLLIDEDQVGFMHGRFIGVNIRNINDVVEHLRSQEDGGIVVSLDYAKAFDSVDRSYLIEVLRSLNFGVNFVRWMHILYSDVQSFVINNGMSTGLFTLHAGLRQGCPISPYLFLLAIEKFASKIRQNNEIEGIPTSLYPDGMTLFLRNGSSLEAAPSMLEEFKQYSGLSLKKIFWTKFWYYCNKS